MARGRAKAFRRRKAGTAPGTLVHTGERRVDRVTIALFQYCDDGLTERQDVTVAECREAVADASKVTWIDMEGLHDVAKLREVGEVFGLHPLVLEDVLNTSQRPRMEDYGQYLYIVAKMLYRGADGHETVSEQVSLILGPHYVVTFQEIAGDVFGPVRERLRAGKGRMRKFGADYLAYGLLDAIVDNYFVVLEDLGERIETLEEVVVTRPTPEVLGDIHEAKREMILLRKALWPVREMVGALQKSGTTLIADSTGVFLRDLYEHAVQVIDMIETQRDTLSSALDIYLSSVSNRMNEVMRVLTVIATLFMPLTFIVGVYGMNFEHMPELKWRYGYAGLWCVMIAVTVGMVVYFRRRKWF